MVLWLTGTVAGMSQLWRYSFTSSNPLKVSGRWPASSRVQRHSGRVSLVMVVHPQCPCSSASIEELNRIMARAPHLSAYVLFYKPSAFPAGWEQGSLWKSARRIPGVQVLSDVDGAEARMFGAQTSGQTLLYSATGELVFSGGITAGRGHSGDNDGEQMILAYLERGTPPQAHTPVYGCSILDRRRGPSPEEIANAGK